MTEQISRDRSAHPPGDDNRLRVDHGLEVRNDDGLSIVPERAALESRPRVVSQPGVVPEQRTPLAPREAIEAHLAELEPAAASSSALKRSLDVLASAFGLLVLAPVLLCVAVIVRLTSPGPALFKQERVGLCGKKFTIVKFRTMHLDADHKLQELLNLHSRGEKPMFKIPDDPRLTAVGKFLRRSSLDELPQLLSVLRGEMSLVGPRPQRMPEIALYENDQFDRLRVRPGMTGMWQVNGRSDIEWEDAVLLDLEYVRTWRPALDIKILWQTVGTVLSGRGAE